MLSNEDLSVDDVILPKESNAVLCQENIDKVEQMHHHSYENEGKQQTLQESPSFAATVKGSESGALLRGRSLAPLHSLQGSKPFFNIGDKERGRDGRDQTRE